jgi:hypothetical protein
MDAPDNTGKATPTQASASSATSDRPFGPDGATILATEHWSLLGTRSLIWNEAMSRTTLFLTVLSASIVALALLADATGFGRRTTAVALVLLPVVFLLVLATYGRLWGALFSLQRLNLRVLHHTSTRFPTPPDEP